MSATELSPHLKGPSRDFVKDERMPLVLNPENKCIVIASIRKAAIIFNLIPI
jgi:hypothetical protein